MKRDIRIMPALSSLAISFLFDLIFINFVSLNLLYLFSLSRRAHVVIVIFALMLQSYSS